MAVSSYNKTALTVKIKVREKRKYGRDRFDHDDVRI